MPSLQRVRSLNSMTDSMLCMTYFMRECHSGTARAVLE
jgi:hypothetical protein